MRVDVTREIDLTELPADAPWRAALEDVAASHVYYYPDDDSPYVELSFTLDVDPPERRTHDYPGCGASVSEVVSATLHAAGKPPKAITRSLANDVAEWLWDSIEEDALIAYDDIMIDEGCDDDRDR